MDQTRNSCIGKQIGYRRAFREDPHLFTVGACARGLSLSVMSNSLYRMDYSPPVPAVHVISFTQEYWSGLPFPSPGESS